MEKVKLIDRDGFTVSLTKEEIANSLKKMGNPKGQYNFVYNGHLYTLPLSLYKEDRNVVLQFLASTMPHYKFWQIWLKKWRWYRGQKRQEKWFRANNPKNLIWKPTPFVLEMPWLRLKGKKAVTINVE